MTLPGAQLVSSRNGDGSQRAVDRSETMDSCGQAAEWGTPRSVGNGAMLNGLVVASKRALPQAHEQFTLVLSVASATGKV